MEDYLEKKERNICEGMSLELRRKAAKIDILVKKLSSEGDALFPSPKLSREGQARGV